MRPRVTSAVPASGASDASLIQDFRIEFSQPMDPSTLGPATVTIEPWDQGLVLEYDEDTAELWLAPTGALPAETELTLSISEGATSEDGSPLEPFSLPFMTGPADCEHRADRLEPNDDPSQVIDLELDVPVRMLSTCGEDEDRLRVTLAERTRVIARTSFRHANEDSWGIYWEREDGAAHGSLGARASQDGERALPHTFEPGSYVLRVWSHDDEELVLYDLELESDEPCEDDAYEDNDFPDEAAEVSSGLLELRGCYVDTDWFSFDVSAGQTIRVTTDTDYTGINRLRIQEPGGDLTVEQTLDPAELTATEDGTALVMRRFWDDGVEYDLTIELLDP